MTVRVRCFLWSLPLAVILLGLYETNLLHKSGKSIRRLLAADLSQNRPKRNGSEFDCAAAARGDFRQYEADTARWERLAGDLYASDEQLEHELQDCSSFLAKRGYKVVPNADRPLQVRLAFVVKAYKNAAQVERLLRAIHEPDHLYCVHVDNKSFALGHLIQALARCVPNVFLSSRRANVHYAHYTNLLADLYCMQDLIYNRHPLWHYLINLTGQEYPLVTNQELKQFVSKLNGSNMIASSIKARDPKRTDTVWVWSVKQGKMVNTGQRLQPPPYNITLYKGSVYGIFSVNFVRYLLENVVVQEFFNWCKNTKNPDEHFWNSLNANKHLHAPGGFTGSLQQLERSTSRLPLRAVVWNGSSAWRCRGRVVRQVCVFGVRDLPYLNKAAARKLFANKFVMNFQPTAYMCMEQLHQRKTLLQNKARDTLS